MTRIDQLRTFHRSVPTRWIDSAAALHRAASHVLSCGFTMLHAAAAFRLRRRTVKQRKLKSHSQGDKYRPTSEHTQNTRLFTARPAHESKEGWIVRTPTRAERKPFPGLHYSETLEASTTACSFEQNLSTCGDAQFAVAYYILKFYTLPRFMHDYAQIYL